MMMVVALVSQMPEFNFVQYFLSEKEAEEEHDRLTHPETSGLLWLSRSASVASYGSRNSTVGQAYRRQTNEKDEVSSAVDIVTNE